MKQNRPTSELQTSAISPAAQPSPDPETVTEQPAIHEEPTVGGSYLRDPVTGALTLNTSKE